MKKLVAMFLALLMIPCLALAEDMGVQVIGGPEEETEPVSLDDVKLNVDVEIDGYGILRPTSFEFNNYVMVYPQGRDDTEDLYNSGNEAEYAILYMDITNTAMSPKDYLANYEVKAVFDDAYEYAGWAYQQNYDNRKWDAWNEYAPYAQKQNVLYGINAADNFPINPMYQGHYLFGCTLPNAVVNSKKPLRLEIKIDGNEIVYNIRK